MYHFKQAGSLFNVLQVNMFKTLKLGKRWNWHAEFYVQKRIGAGPVNLPLLYTRNRIAYEGNLGFKNLDISMGAEIRYRSPYKADGYSPVMGRFYYQDSITIRNPLPDISVFVQFRIKPFKFFIRGENLNTLRRLDNFGFTNNNLVAPAYPLPGLQIRMGVWWGFVNWLPIYYPFFLFIFLGSIVLLHWGFDIDDAGNLGLLVCAGYYFFKKLAVQCNFYYFIIQKVTQFILSIPSAFSLPHPPPAPPQ